MPTDLFIKAASGVKTVLGLEEKHDQSTESMVRRVFEHPDVCVRFQVAETSHTETGPVTLDISPTEAYAHGQHQALVKEVVADVMSAFRKAVAGTDRRTTIFCAGPRETVGEVFEGLAFLSQ